MQRRFAILLFFSLLAGLLALIHELPAHAVTSVPTKMNFQGRVTNSSGNILANGTYNMKFRIWSAASAGTQLWSEDRLVSAAQGVVVTNGQFSVQLGDVTSLPASVFTSSSLYFEVELPTPASATSSSPVWTEGAMTPRNQLATSAYAFNSETLDGLDSAAFGQLDQNNVFTGNNTFNGTLQGGSSLTLGTASVAGSLVISDGSSNIGTIAMAPTAGNYTYTIPVTTANDTFCLQTLANCGAGGGVSTVGALDGGTANATGASIVDSTFYLQSASASFAGLINTTTQTFAGNKTFNGTLAVVSAATFSGSLTVGTSTNGIVLTDTGLTIAGTARATKTVMLAPEFPGATFTAITANSNGSLSSDFCSGSALLNVNTTVCDTTDEHNYYAWTTTQVAAQDYGVFVRYRMPSDYDTGSMTNLKLWGRGTSASEVVGVVMYKGATVCGTIADVVTGANTWVETTLASPLGSCTINPDDIVTFKFTMTATTNNTASLGELTYTYRSRF